MRKAFAGLAALLMLVVVVQFFLAGMGAFDTAPNEESFAPHRALGYWTVLLAVVLTVVAALARMPGRLIGLSGLVAGLGILQPVIGVVAKAFGDSEQTTTAGQLVFGLHTVNALVIIAVAHNVFRQARKLTAPAHTTQADAGDGSSAADAARSAS
jgi:Family of unknown function (DUF6220)